MRIAVIAALLMCLVGAAAQEPPPIELTVERFDVVGENPLSPAVTDETLKPFLGTYSELGGLMAAVDALEQALRIAGYNFHRVSIQPTPEGQPASTVVLKVLAFGLGNVTVRGNQHFTEQSVRNSLPVLSSGAVPGTAEMSRELAVANQHPRKRVSVNFRPSEEADKLDAQVRVEDQRPWSLFSNLNNIGSEDTGRLRMLLGGQYANVTGHDDVLTTSITISPDNIDNVLQFGAFYQLPVYQAHGWLSAFHVRSDVDVGNVQNAFDISGAGEFTGLNFKHQLIGVGSYRHTLSLGLQDRLFDTAISNSITGIQNLGISTKVRSRPVTLRYDGGYNWLKSKTSFDFFVDFTKNLDFGGHNNKRDYAKVRAVADPSWKVLRFGALLTQQLPGGFSGVIRANGQYSADPLIPGEELGFGGERSVRGFEERTIAGDTGLVTSIELWSPPVERLYGVRFLGFLDGAYKKLNDPLAGQRPDDAISSGGVGARWQWREQLQVALDYGAPIGHASGEASDRGHGKWHFSLSYRY